VNLGTCCCASWPDAPCTATPTQEDLRCDNCRAGCDLVMFDVLEPFHGQAYISFTPVAPRVP
jgi:hypothetical protein